MSGVTYLILLFVISELQAPETLEICQNVTTTHLQDVLRNIEHSDEMTQLQCGTAVTC
jgi:hypothetical protein